MWSFDKFGMKTAIIDEHGTSITYSQLKTEGERISNYVYGRCLVFCLCRNSLGSVIGYTSFVEHDIVPVLLNANLDRNFLCDLLDKYYPSYLWIPEEKASEFGNFKIVCKRYDYVLVQTSYSKKYAMHEDLCLLLTTSGSTGSPKFVRQSYKNVRVNAQSIVQYLKLDETERPITTLPMNYTYGLSIINSHFMVGATLLVTEKGMMQKEFWQFFKENQATSFGGVPYTYEILDRLRFYRMKLPSLRYTTQAGGKLVPELHKKFAENALEQNRKFFVMYGQCEATARMGYLPAEMSVEKCGSMGIAIPGGKFHLIDADGNNIVDHLITGELVYEGDNVTMGYAESGEDLIRGDERNGILHTGDMAKFDEDGYFYIVGRKKRFLKIYGNRVNLDEIDRLIKSHFANMECATAGIDDHVYIFITDRSLEDKVRNFIIEKTGLNPVAFRTIALDEIPKNDAGKTLYSELVKYYE